MSAILRMWRRLRLALWAASVRTRLRWSGMRLSLSAAEPPAGPLPRVETVGRGGGTLKLHLGRDVRFGPGVQIEVEPGGDSSLEIQDSVRLSAGARFKLRRGRIAVGSRTLLRDGAILKSSGSIVIGEECIVSYGVVVHCARSVHLEDLVALGDRVTVVDSAHETDGSDTPWSDQPAPAEPVVVGRNTLVFANATILRGSHVGRNSVIGAGAVVSGAHPRGVVLAGAPAEVVRTLPAGG